MSNPVPKVQIPKVLSDTGNLYYNNISINVKVTFLRQIFHFPKFRENFVDKDIKNHPSAFALWEQVKSPDGCGPAYAESPPVLVYVPLWQWQ